MKDDEDPRPGAGIYAPIAPRCPHVADGCGGCHWQHLQPEAQLQSKQDRVRDCLAHRELGPLPLRPVLAAPSPWQYRNRMDFTFNPRGGLGLHPRQDWDRVIGLETCLIAAPLTVELLRAARAHALERGLALYDPRAHTGWLRQLTVRESVATGQALVGLVTKPGETPGLEALAAHLAAVSPRVTGVVHAVQSGVDHGPLEVVRVLHGAPTIVERLAGVELEIGLLTFFQSNTAAAEALVGLVLDLAGPLEGALVYDLFCGIGTFTLPLARRAARVVGLEVAEESIAAARQNALRNGIENVELHAGEARLALPELQRRTGPPRVVVLDPPRNGTGGRVMRKIARLGAERIVYVSCGPRSLAEDLKELLPSGYRLEVVQPVDLFPQTRHVEAVVALQRVPGSTPVPERERRRRQAARRAAQSGQAPAQDPPA